jgi:acyl-CoA thioester hydrolase
MQDWDLPSPHIHRVVATSADIDGYGHVNNAVYVTWLDHTAWSHSTALGIPPESCIEGRRGMAVWRTQVNYLAPAFAGNRVDIGTWIVASDSRLRCARRFQMRRADDGVTLLRALIHYVCIDLDSGKARRMPPEFVAGYQPLEIVRDALSAQPASFAPGVEPGT